MGGRPLDVTIGKLYDLFGIPQAASSSSESDTRSVAVEYPVVRGPSNTGPDGVTTVPTDAEVTSLVVVTADADVHDVVFVSDVADEYSAQRQATTAHKLTV